MIIILTYCMLLGIYQCNYKAVVKIFILSELIMQHLRSSWSIFWITSHIYWAFGLINSYPVYVHYSWEDQLVKVNVTEVFRLSLSKLNSFIFYSFVYSQYPDWELYTLVLHLRAFVQYLRLDQVPLPNQIESMLIHHLKPKSITIFR